MALSSAIVIEVRTTGSDNNGGGFKTGATGTDRSQQNGAFATLTAASVVHTTTTQINVSLGDFTVSAADVGNLLQITGGTATPGFYEITVVDVPNNRWTMDRSVGTAAQTVIGAMGGALLTLGKAGSAPLVDNNKIWIKAGTYLITSATINIAGGCFSKTVGVFIEGYNTARGDLGTKPLLQASGITAFTFILNTGNSANTVTNLKIDGAGLTTGRGIQTRHRGYKIEAVNFTNSAFVGDFQTGWYVECSATGCSTQPAFLDCNTIGCTAFDNTNIGFGSSGSATPNTHVYSVADTNTGASSDGFSSGGASQTSDRYINCTAYANGRDGFRTIGVRGGTTINCIAESNGGWGFNNVNNNGMNYYSCAGFGNASGELTQGTGVQCVNFNFVTGSGSFFTNAAGQDFSLNNTAGRGAALKGVGFPGIFPGLSTTGYLDIGAAQVQATGGGSSEKHHSF